MSAFRWLVVVGAAAAVLIAVGITIGGVWLNTFIHSEGFRNEVETRAGATLGGPVRIEAIDFSIFSGVKLRGVEAQIDSSHVNGQGALSAQVESVDCTYALGDLLRRRLKLTGVTLEKPVIVLTRQALPASEPAAGAGAAPTVGGGQAQPAPFQFILDGAKIKDGSFSMRDARGASLTEISGVNAEADISGYYEGKNVTGKLKIADVAFTPNLHVTDLSVPWTFDPHGNFITAKPFEGAAFDGRLAGDYVIDATGPSLLDVNARGLDMGAISRTAETSNPILLSGSLDVESKWRGVESGQINGEGDAQLVNGQLQGVRMLEELSSVLRLRELREPQLKAVHTHFEVANGQTRFTGLQVDADTFQMTGDGVIESDGGLNANMVLILSSEAMGRLPGGSSAFLVRQPDGSGSIAFHLGGTIHDPRTDLAVRLLMRSAAVKNVISNALNRFFNRHHKAAQDVPAPAEAPSPDPTAPPEQNPAPAPVPVPASP